MINQNFFLQNIKVFLHHVSVFLKFDPVLDLIKISEIPPPAQGRFIINNPSVENVFFLNWKSKICNAKFLFLKSHFDSNHIFRNAY